MKKHVIEAPVLENVPIADGIYRMEDVCAAIVDNLRREV